MGILGLTHDENGAAFEKLPVTIKVAIGEGPEPGEEGGHPQGLDHFVFKQKTLRGQDVVWAPAPEITHAHAEKPTKLGIVFLESDPREVFRTEYALWTPSGCKCRGELVQIAANGEPRFEMRAMRKTRKHPEGEGWPGNYKYIDGPKKGLCVEPCGDRCPDLKRRDCRPSGDLYFMLEKFPTFGAICRLHTSSYRSVRNLSNGLMQIWKLNRRRLTGIKAVLKVSPEKISYCSRDGMRHSAVVQILSLEMGASDLRTLVANMTEQVGLLSGEGEPGASRGVPQVVRERDEERAQEIAAEFYPNGEAAAPELPRSDDQPDERDNQLARICELAQRLGYNQARTRMLLGQSAGNLADLERKLLNELDEAAGENGAPGQCERVNRKTNESSGRNRPGTSERAAPDAPMMGLPGFFF